MRYLLDTCALVWLMKEPGKLSSRVVGIIEDMHNEVYASTISFWEMSLKASIGKMDFEGIDIEEIEAVLVDDFFIGIIGLNEQESLSFCHLPFFDDHRDPFDRMLAWQAIKRDMALISCDPAFEQYRQCGLRVVW